MSSGEESPFNCDACSERDKAARNCCNRQGLSEELLCVSSYTESLSGEIKELNAKKVFNLGGLRLYECPLSYITVESCDLIRLVYLTDDTGMLLFDGAWGAQPAWLIEAYEVFSSERARRLKGDSSV